MTEDKYEVKVQYFKDIPVDDFEVFMTRSPVKLHQKLPQGM